MFSKLLLLVKYCLKKPLVYSFKQRSHEYASVFANDTQGKDEGMPTFKNNLFSDETCKYHSVQTKFRSQVKLSNCWINYAAEITGCGELVRYAEINTQPENG